MLDLIGPVIPVWVYCLTLYFCYGNYIGGPPLVIVKHVGMFSHIELSS